METGPCQNRNCNSYGHVHPNCKCYMAEGGAVTYCASGMPHMQGCEYYASGGEVEPEESPETSLGHAAVEHGLLGLMKNVGKAKLSNPSDHRKFLEDAHMQRDRLQNPMPGEEPMKKSMGVKLANHHHTKSHDDAAEMMHGHPLMGSLSKTSIKALMPRLSGMMMDNDPHPEGMRAASDYFHSAIKGHDRLDSDIDSIFGKGKMDRSISDSKMRDALKEQLNNANLNPENLLDVGGDLGSYLPKHQTQLAATIATAKDYLEAIKPKGVQLSALDPLTKPSKFQETEYNRQLDVAQSPTIILQRVKDGTLLPQDIKTVQTIYPGLYKSIQQKASAALIGAKDNGTLIPSKQRQTLSMLLGEPLDSLQTPQVMQGIIRAQGMQQQQLQAKTQAQAKKSKATAVELKQINKVDSLYATPLQAREMDKKE